MERGKKDAFNLPVEKGGQAKLKVPWHESSGNGIA